ncbi:MAG: ferric reductase-like transmembrane domain-containing protein [Acidimicrobiales bacterium]|nr:ferric reductase-like transmembrane domain-containing protein [Acidimicrobiales bacterium]
MHISLNPQFWWFLTRASGIVAWLMLTATVVWGVVLATRAFPEHRRPAWLRDLHTWLGGLSVCFVAVHLGALVADSYVSFGPTDLLVPFASDWKPIPVALGVFAFWILVAVQVTSLARKHLPRSLWRWVHLSSYATFWFTSLHAAYAGTDRAAGLYQITAVATIVAIAWSMMYRVTNRKPGRRAAGPSSSPAPTGANPPNAPTVPSGDRRPIVWP